MQRWTSLDSTVHNLTVGDLHTYYALAGAAPVLVHNDSCPTGTGKGSAGDHERYESATDYPVISFIWPSKKLRGSVVQSQERAGHMVTTDLEDLLAVIAP